MATLPSDKTGSQSLEPIIWNPTTVDNYHDPTVIGRNAVSQGDNIIFDDGIIEKIPGTTKGNSDTAPSACMGLHRSYAQDGTKTCLRLSDGYLKSGPSAFATTILSNLAKNKRTPWIDIRGKAYGINETDGIIRYDGKTGLGYKTGIVGPALRKKIAFMEDDETWDTGHGGSQVHSVYRGEEWQGDAVTSLKLNCSAASTTARASASMALDLSQFSDGKSAATDDFITFYTWHDIRARVSALHINFHTKGTGYTHSYQLKLDPDNLAEKDYEWTRWNVRRGAFETLSGTPDWSKVSACKVTAVSNVSGACNVHWDYMYMKSSPIRAYELRKRLFNCEGTNETWTGKRWNFSPKNHEGNRSVQLSATVAGTQVSASCTLSTAVDLTKWANGSSTSTSDEFCFWIRCNDITALTDTNPLTLWVGSDASNYKVRTYSKLSALGLTGSDQWIEVRETRARISATGSGSFSWTNAAYFRFTTSTFTGANKRLWIDDCSFQQKNEYKQIATFEPDDETWTVTGNGKHVKDAQGKGWVSEGTYALKLWSPNPGHWGESSALYDFHTSVKDLTLFSDGTVSGDDDEICFNLFIQRRKEIDYVELWLDNNSLASFVDAYKIRIEKIDFPIKPFTGKEIRIKKSDFERVGTTADVGWDEIGAAKVVVYSRGNNEEGAVYFDDLILKRKGGKTGRYYYKYIFRVADIASACSEDSDYIDVKSSMVSLSNIATSQDSRVTSREIYRLGGSYPDAWMLVKIIGDNTTTEIVDDVDDTDLTLVSLGQDVPLGWVNSVLGNNLAYDGANDRCLFWGDPTYKNRVYYSHNLYPYVVDQAGYREFPDEVMFVVPWFGQEIIFYKNRVQKVIGDLPTGELVDLPANMGTCSYWGVGKPYKGFIPYVGWDNVYLFDGTREMPIGDVIKGYFKGRESYLSTVTIAQNKDVFYIACKDKTGTPTYNDTVLRCYLPTQSWSILPDWNVECWSNWDKVDDQNQLYYGSSTDGNIYSINSGTYQFDSTDIDSTLSTGWISNPLGAIAVTRIEFQAKGTAGSTIVISGYKDLSDIPLITGGPSLTADWQVFRIANKNLMDYMRGNYLKFIFAQTVQTAYFKMKDIVIYTELLADRTSITTSNEILLEPPA